MAYPQANGQAERYVGLIKNALKKYCAYAESWQDWREYLGEILMGLRFLVTRSHGYSPFFCVHGFEVDLPTFLQQEGMKIPNTPSDDEII